MPHPIQSIFSPDFALTPTNSRAVAEICIRLDGIASLMDKSLLHQVEAEGEEPRLLMLETIREYGLAVDVLVGTWLLE